MIATIPVGGVTEVARAHQRRIRDAAAIAEPRPSAASLADYHVTFITKHQAAKIILKYEWLGNMGRSQFFVGLLAPDGSVEGAACFGYGPGGNIRNIIGAPALCLERGACVHYAPRNAASFLIARACKLMWKTTGVERFYAYGDPMAGEYGAVYQAAGWAYLGQGLMGNGRQRRWRTFVLPPGGNADNPGEWRTTRVLRTKSRRLGYEEAERLGWRIRREKDKEQEGKHVYATHVGDGRKVWRASVATFPYPAPRPELKLASSPKFPALALDGKRQAEHSAVLALHSARHGRKEA